MTLQAPAQARKTSQTASRPIASGLLQRKCACGGDAGISGEREECRRKKLGGVQAKLAVSLPGDRWEQEADRMAEQVVSTAGPVQAADRQDAPRVMCQPAAPTATSGLPHRVAESIRTPGAPLDAATRSFMEARFDYDFSRVRIHQDAAAARSAQEVNALAYTLGHNIVFASGQYDPGSSAGRRLLAHELTHVVQQSPAAPQSAPLQGKSGRTIQPARQAGLAPSAYSLRLILPGGERFIGPPALTSAGTPVNEAVPAEAPVEERRPPVEGGTIAEEESAPRLLRKAAIGQHYDGPNPFLQRSAAFINPTPVAQDPLARLAAGDPPGLTTPTINGNVMATEQDIRREITPTQVSQTGAAGGQVTCRVDPSFTINTSANMIVASNAGPGGWVGMIPPAVLGNPPACAAQAQIPATMNAQPSNGDFVTRVRTSEGEHAAELRALHDRHLAPYDRWVTGLTGTGPNLAAAGQNLVAQLGNRPLQASFGFTLGNAAQVNRLDGPGGTHADTAAPTFGPGCASVAISVSQTRPTIPGSGPGNVVPVLPATTSFRAASLSVVGSNLMNGGVVFKAFSSAGNAQQALDVIRHYRLNSRNTIGPLEYFLRSGVPPGGPIPGANELEIDPALHQVSAGVPGLGASDWAITQIVGNNINVLVNFHANRDQAYSAWNILQGYGFTRLCWVGGTRQAPEMMYFRIEQSAFSEPGDYNPPNLPPGQHYA